MREIRKSSLHKLCGVVCSVACVAMLIALFAGVASACPTCKQAIAENDPNGQSYVTGYFYSILFMMSAPFAVLGTFCSMAFIVIRRAKNEATDSTSLKFGSQSVEPSPRTEFED